MILNILNSVLKDGMTIRILDRIRIHKINLWLQRTVDPPSGVGSDPGKDTDTEPNIDLTYSELRSAGWADRWPSGWRCSSYAPAFASASRTETNVNQCASCTAQLSNFEIIKTAWFYI